MQIACEPTDSGTANLYGTDLPADRANQAMRRINRLARKAKNAGDRRGIDQIRADLFLDLLTGGGEKSLNAKPKRSDRAHVDITVDLTTLLGLDENPGEIPGWGPVIADVARQITEHSHDGEWRVGIAEHDQLSDVITTRRRPNTIQKRIVETLQPECVFPTCRIGSSECDLDHEIPWAVTHETSIRHLEPLCRHHHHRAKHGHWKLKQIRPGVYQWTSPLGHTYTTTPDLP